MRSVDTLDPKDRSRLKAFRAVARDVRSASLVEPGQGDGTRVEPSFQQEIGALLAGLPSEPLNSLAAAVRRAYMSGSRAHFSVSAISSGRAVPRLHSNSLRRSGEATPERWRAESNCSPVAAS